MLPTQVAVASWLDKVTPGQTDAACALLVDLAVSGLLCPGQYLATLVAKVYPHHMLEALFGSTRGVLRGHGV